MNKKHAAANGTTPHVNPYAPTNGTAPTHNPYGILNCSSNWVVN